MTKNRRVDGSAAEQPSTPDKGDVPLARYRCRYTDSPLIDNGVLTSVLQLKATDAEAAARITQVVTGCKCVLSVERIDDEVHGEVPGAGPG